MLPLGNQGREAVKTRAEAVNPVIGVRIAIASLRKIPYACHLRFHIKFSRAFSVSFSEDFHAKNMAIEIQNG